MGKDYYANRVCANFLRLMRAKKYMGLKHILARSMYGVAGVSDMIVLHMRASFARVCMFT
jgi:hypothetical protein